MGFIGNDHDVAPLGKQRIGIAFVLREELLDGGEDDPAGGHLEQFAQVSSAFGLHRGLAQDLPVGGKGGKELVV